MIQDTREQDGLYFPPDGVFTATRIETLPVGDYACEFLDHTRPPIIFERKSLNDLFGTMTKGHVRFKKELTKAADLKIKLILIVEGSLSAVLQGVEHSAYAGSSCIQKLFTLFLKYDLMPVFCLNRQEMVEYIKAFYAAVGRCHVAAQRH